MLSAITRLALTYWDIGWGVIPCHVPVKGGCSCGRDYCEWPGKHPRLPWTEFTTKRASRNTVCEWFESEYYGSNIGITTGLVSGIAVVDVDHGALDAFASMKLPYTGLIALSGSGEGVHYYYRLTEPLRSGKPVENIDLKADGGFIVLPPSQHMSGRTYEWFRIGSLGVLEPGMLPEVVATRTEAGSDWYDELFAGCYEGERSISSVRLAGRYAALGLSETEAMNLMFAWNQGSVHPPLPDREIDRAIRWAYRTHVPNEEITTSADILQLLKGR